MWPLLACALLGCPKSGTVETDPLEVLLQRVDRAWADRATLGLEASEEPLDQAYGIAPRHPEVLWRLVRNQITLGLAESTPRAAAYAFAEGRSLGIACLDTVPAVAATRRTSWADALTQVPTSHRPCVAWTGLAWARWMAAMGGGASSLDLPRAQALAESAQSDSGDLQALGLWADGLLYSTIPEWAGHSDAFGLSRLDRVRDHWPSDPVVQADRLLFAGDAIPADQRSADLANLRALDTRAADHAAALARVDAAFPPPPEPLP